MINNYFNDTRLNFVEASKTFQGSDQVRRITTNPTSTINCSKVLPSLKEELDSLSNLHSNLDSKVMVEDYILLKNTIFEEISKKLGSSRSNIQIKETIEKNLDIQVEFFIQCFQTVEKSNIFLIQKKLTYIT
jgi:hypothetical protein